jgi:tRNA A37 methylthiotransferase MiaB
MDDLTEEAKYLAESGYSELILTAQDTTKYGLDLYGKRMLPELIRNLSDIEGVRSIRIMYSYSDGITDELVREMKNNPKVAHYLDMPVQHGDDGILSSMKRLILPHPLRLDSEIERSHTDIILRTNVLVGFPGETGEAFSNLIEQLKIWQFDRLAGFVLTRRGDRCIFDEGQGTKEKSALRDKRMSWSCSSRFRFSIIRHAFIKSIRLHLNLFQMMVYFTWAEATVKHPKWIRPSTSQPPKKPRKSEDYCGRIC